MWILRVGGSNISGEMNYPSFTNCVECKFKGDKYLKGIQIYQKFLFQGVQIFQRNYPGSKYINIFGLGKLKWGIHFLHDRSNKPPSTV